MLLLHPILSERELLSYCVYQNDYSSLKNLDNEVTNCD